MASSGLGAIMKTKLYLLLLFACSCFAIEGRAAVTLPDSCGKDEVRFEAKATKNPPAPGGPAEGKAQIFFMENENQMVEPFSYVTVRYGMDGAWVGADNGTSYFVLMVDPGVHHLCASWQSSLKTFEKNVDVTSFTAEAGKAYYFSAAVTVESREVVTFGLSQLNDDQGKFRVKSARLSTSKPKQP